MISVGRARSPWRRVNARVSRVDLDVLAEVHDLPAVGLVALADVLGERLRGVALDRDVVVVVEDDQAAELQVAGERRGLGLDALLHVAVGGDHEGVVVDDVAEARVEHALGQRHADRRGDALAERAGRRLDADRVPLLRVARRLGLELAERLEVVHRDVVARQVQDRVQEHRGVPGAQHEAVAVEPVRVRGVVLHHLRVERVGHRRERHRRARMARVRLLDRVHRQGPDGVDGQLLETGLLGGRTHVAGLLWSRGGKRNAGDSLRTLSI